MLFNKGDHAYWKSYLRSSNNELIQIYGENSTEDRRLFILNGLQQFVKNFGDNDSITVFRAPARINFRGMHVDRHGGATNGIAINREIVLIGIINPEKVIIENSPRGRFECDINEISTKLKEVNAGWEKYLLSGLETARIILEANKLTLSNGFNAEILSDIPQGAGLSSSHAFLVAIICFTLTHNGYHVDGEHFHFLFLFKFH